MPPCSLELRHQQATLDGRLDATLEESVIDDLLRVEGPHAGPDLRFGTPGCLRQRPPVGGDDIHGIAGTGATFEAVDRGGKDPRMMAGKLNDPCPAGERVEPC
jgi:hypothetical protein